MMVFARLPLAVALCLALGIGQALAAGGGSSTAKKADPGYAQAVKLVEAGNYATAIPLLQKSIADDPTNADAHNYLGYSHRKLGDIETALAEYRTALELDPRHRGANEYLGELYLEQDKLDKAKERLAVLDDACFFGCEEYRELKEKIKVYEAKTGS